MVRERFKPYCCTPILILWAMLCPLLVAGDRTYHSNHFPILHDPGKNHLQALHQDQAGRIWAGGSLGLSRFDGVSFATFPARKDQGTESLTDILCLAEDRNGGLWIGTRHDGFYYLNPISENLTQYAHRPNHPQTTAAGPIHALLADDESSLLLIAAGAGLSALDTTAGAFSHFNPKHTGPITSMLRGRARTIWLGGESGLTRATIKPGTKLDLRFSQIRTEGQPNRPVTALYQSTNDTLWGAFEDQLFRLDPTSDTPVPIHRIDGRINGLTEDRMGHIWIASSSGMFKFDRALGSLQGPIPTALESSEYPNHKAVITGQEGLLWAATQHGLINLNPEPSAIRGYLHHKNTDGVTAVSGNPNSPHIIWAGTANGNLKKLDRQTGIATTIPLTIPGAQPGPIRAILDRENDLLVGGAFGAGKVDKSSASISTIISDGVNQILTEPMNSQRVWLGTDGVGLVRYDLESGASERYPMAAQTQAGPASNHITALLRDSHGDLWLGTAASGLSHMEAPGRFHHYRAEPDFKDALSNNRISAMVELNGHIWIGTYGGGLNRMDRDNGRFHAWRKRHGLPDNTIHAMVTDASNRLWLSTNAGLAVFNPADVSFRTYGPLDGVLGHQFNPAAALSRPNHIYFGSERGLTEIALNLLRDRPTLAAELHNIRLPGQPLQADGLTREGLKITAMTLPAKAPLVTLHFRALDFSTPLEPTCQYRLEGLDTQWTKGISGRPAAYTGLPAGEYSFQIRALNRDGVWGPTSEIPIRVTQTSLSRLWLIPIILLILAAAVLLIRRRRPLPNDDPTPVEAQSKLLREQFLADSSAELRAPINGIVGLAETLLDGADGSISSKTRAHLEMIRNSGRRLTHVVDEIIDFSHLKSEMQKLNLQRVDVHSMADVVLSTLQEQAKDSKVSLINRTPSVLPTITADPKRLKQILINLVENGLSACEGGAISLLAEQQDDQVRIAVRHTGITDEQPLGPIEDIGDSFDIATSTRLGLEIARMLIGLHGSRLQVEKHPDEGVTWFFQLAAASLEPATPTKRDQTELPPALPRNEWYDVSTETQAAGMAAGHDEFRVLIVDDEQINRMLLTEFLRLQNYDAVDAADGPEALAILESHAFDLVLLDIMMPRMSGYEVCRQIRRTYSEEALPVIFLSAKDQASDAAAGFEAGGNDYLAKPVSKKELLIRIRLHLRNLEVNRRLEALISERTAKLAARTKDLEEMNQEILKTREQVILQEKMAGLGMVTAGLAHEINNPTNFTFSAAQTMKRELENFKVFLFQLAGEDAEAEVLEAFESKLNPLFKQITTIEDGCRRLVELVSDIRSASRTDRAHPVTADLNKGLRTTLRLVRTHYKHQVNFHLNLSGDAHVTGMPNQLNQVFMNLMVNACQAVVKRLQSEHADHDEPPSGNVSIRSHVAAGRVQIEIEDDGCGMPESLRAKIFEPFFTTKSEEGTGLGLSISKDIITRHGGELSVTSVEGKGSTFVLSLPYQHTEADHEAIQ